MTDADLALVADLICATWTARVSPQRLTDVRRIAGSSLVTGRRAWSEITGIVLHQTACVLGERHERWASIGAHVGVTRGGQVVHMHDFTSVVVHGHGFNADTVGLECDGMYAGIEGDERTFWRPRSEPDRRPQTPTAEQIDAARAAIRWIVAEVARHGGRVTGLYAHRQSSRDRQSDPGSALWQSVAMPMHAELGLSDGGPGYFVGSGMPIPAEWDPARVGVRY